MTAYYELFWQPRSATMMVRCLEPEIPLAEAFAAGAQLGDLLEMAQRITVGETDRLQVGDVCDECGRPATLAGPDGTRSCSACVESARLGAPTLDTLCSCGHRFGAHNAGNPKDCSAAGCNCEMFAKRVDDAPEA